MRFTVIRAFVLLLLCAACGSDSTGPREQQLTNGTLTMRVDGQSYGAVSAAVVVTGGNIIGIGAANASGHAFGMAWMHDGLRTYTIGSDIGLNGNYHAGGGAHWIAGSGMGSGSVTVTTSTSNRVAGTFSFVMQPVANSSATGTRTITQGTFDLTF